MSLKILVLGVNGFIGSGLTEAILKDTDWEIYGMDMANDKITQSLQNQRFHFTEGDIDINKEWVEYHIKNATSPVMKISVHAFLLFAMLKSVWVGNPKPISLPLLSKP